MFELQKLSFQTPKFIFEPNQTKCSLNLLHWSTDTETGRPIVIGRPSQSTSRPASFPKTAWVDRKSHFHPINPILTPPTRIQTSYEPILICPNLFPLHQIPKTLRSILDLTSFPVFVLFTPQIILHPISATSLNPVGSSGRSEVC